MTDAKPEHPRSPHWSAVRAAHLKQHPACAACGGTEALEVHHCLPYHIFPELELAESNLTTLCEKTGHDCHFVFGHGGFWRGWIVTVRADAAKHLADVAKSFGLAQQKAT